MRVDKPCNTNSNSTCQERSESVSEITYLVMRQKAKVRVFSNKPEEEKFYRSGHELGYNISCSVEGFEINRTSASVYFRPCISYDNCQVQTRFICLEGTAIPRKSPTPVTVWSWSRWMASPTTATTSTSPACAPPWKEPPCEVAWSAAKSVWWRG